MLAPARSRFALDTRTAHLLALAIPGALLTGAIGSQLFAGLIPCEMCIWQRWPHGMALLLAGLGFVMPSRRRLFILLAALAIALSGAIGFYHAGVEIGVFPGLTTCSTTAGGSLADIMAAPVVRCDAIQWSLLGISMAGWNAIISLGACLLILLGLRKGGA